jgi:hypothetical protein
MYYIPIKANGYVVRNGTIRSTERVAMRHHHSVYSLRLQRPYWIDKHWLLSEYSR